MQKLSEKGHLLFLIISVCPNFLLLIIYISFIAVYTSASSNLFLMKIQWETTLFQKPQKSDEKKFSLVHFPNYHPREIVGKFDEHKFLMGSFCVNCSQEVFFVGYVQPVQIQAE